MAYKPKLLTLAESGTGAALTASNGGILYSNATTAAVLAGTATANQVLLSGSSTTPAWSTSTYPATATGTGKILIADGTNWIASTPTFPNTSGTSGKVLVSDGTNNVYSTPTFPNASATSGKIIKSDGTNWVASTETYAAPGTSGNVLTSNGTNWTSAAPAGSGLTTVSGSLTNSQVKNLHGTPVQIIAAPGSGKIIDVVHYILTMNYGGTNVFTAGSGQTINLFYGTTTSIGNSTLSNSQITAAASQATTETGGVQTTYANASNAAVNLYVSSATEISGNAANDNTVSYSVMYRTITIP